MKAGARVTGRVVAALEQEIGAPLRVVDVTEHGDREPMFLIITPRCPYCGNLNPRMVCRTCGAGTPVH